MTVAVVATCASDGSATNTHGAIVGQVTGTPDWSHGAERGAEAASSVAVDPPMSIPAMSTLRGAEAAAKVARADGMGHPGPPLTSVSWSAAKLTRSVRSLRTRTMGGE